MFNETYRLQTAVLERWKTMTRRLVPNGTPCGCWSETVKYSRYQVGEVVAIAQSYRSITEEEEEINGVLGLYRIGQKYLTMDEMGAGWNNKLFVRADLMPHHIRITDVKIERLQDISDADCLREGIRQSAIEYKGKKIVQYTYFGEKRTIWYDSPREAFAALIDRISGKGTWESNPYLFAYEFELVD